VVRIATATYGERHPRTSASLGNLANALSGSGQYDAAASYYEKAGEIQLALFGPASLEAAGNLYQRAVNLALGGKTSQATELAARSEDISRAFDLIAIRTMPEREALLHVGAKASGQRSSGLNTLLSLAAAGAPGGLALDALIRSRAVVFDELAARRRAAESGDPEVARMAAGLAAAREELARLVVRVPKSMTASQYQAALDRARENKYEAERLLAEVAPQIESILGDRIYSRNGDPLEAVLGQRLRERGESVSVAESCTGGMLAERITSIPGSSDYFLGGFLVYTDRMKTELLGVSEDLLREHTAVSEEAAREMARGARERTGSTWALSVTGVAGPSGGTEAAPIGTVIIGVAGPDGAATRRERLPGDRTRVRTLATQAALDLLRLRLT